ncbi:MULTISPECIES: citrate/2-methylcitrate synthase [Amycolatopsis]|uniref:citrate synthase (unknown stereospecificity) n=1 Tax=Amycolatopsis bullii TaxID=941987 RepID=A0ABQ3KL61_9PSEU|nr:citrate/2-methylcitrate synthase [Amycolatopsis bullii]GHG34769.1 citrate synthase [Amycolatopsis bullii]
MATDETAALTTDQAARLLGVKPETVYAYVSRGLLSRRRGEDGRSSRFAADEVRQLAAKHARGVPAKGSTSSIETRLTSITDGRLYYRGEDVARLAGSAGFEAVVALLWTGSLDEPQRLSAPAATTKRAKTAIKPLAADARPCDLLPIVVAAAATADPLRYDVQPDTVVRTGRTLLAVLAEALPKIGAEPRQPSLAARLWPALTSRPPTDEALRALDAAMVLLADHDLAASTMAARLAASTRAHPYAVVGAGLGVLDGPRHGAAAGLAHRFLRDALRGGDPVGELSEHLRDGGGQAPGFGEDFYPAGDPRAARLLEILLDTGLPNDLKSTVVRLRDATADRPRIRPNVDFALAVLCHANEMVAGAGETIRAVARTAGWIAHALEEYREPPDRLRPTGIYTGARARRGPSADTYR